MNIHEAGRTDVRPDTQSVRDPALSAIFRVLNEIVLQHPQTTLSSGNCHADH